MSRQFTSKNSKGRKQCSGRFLKKEKYAYSLDTLYRPALLNKLSVVT